MLRLGTVHEHGGNTFWLSLKRYPALLLLFSLGVGALAGGRLDLLGRLFSARMYEVNKGDLPVVQVLPDNCLAGDVVGAGKFLPGMEKRYYGLSDWISGAIRQCTRDIIPNDTQYSLVFAKLELLLALGFAHHGSRRFGYWVPQGTFAYLDDERGPDSKRDPRVLRQAERRISIRQKRYFRRYSGYLQTGDRGPHSVLVYAAKILAAMEPHSLREGLDWGTVRHPFYLLILHKAARNSR